MAKINTREQLSQLLAPLGTESETTHLLGLIMHKATQLLQADRSTLFLIDERTGELWSKIAQGLATIEIRMPSDAGIAGHVAATGVTLNLTDAYQSSHFNPQWDERTGYRTKSVLCMPLRDPRSAIVGVIEVLNKRDDRFTQEDERLLAVLCAQAAILVVALNAERA